MRIITHRKLVDLVAKRSEVPPQIVESMIEDITAEICEWLSVGSPVTIGQLVTLKPMRKRVGHGLVHGLEVGDIHYKAHRWKIALVPGPMAKMAISVLPVMYKKIRVKAGGRVEDVIQRYCRPEGGNDGAGVGDGERVPETAGG